MSRLEPKSLTERTYFEIRANILACKHRPGEQLRITTLCAELGASLGAVREALSRLSAEGLVVAEAQRGFKVSVVSLAELDDITRTRVMIEGICLEQAIQNGGVEWEAGIVSAFHRLSRLPHFFGKSSPHLPEEWASAHSSFHESLVAACGSSWLLRIRALLFEQSDRYRRLAAATFDSSRDVDTEHREIMDAVLLRDTRLSKVLIENHLRMTSDVVAKYVREEVENRPRTPRGRRRDKPDQLSLKATSKDVVLEVIRGNR